MKGPCQNAIVNWVGASSLATDRRHPQSAIRLRSHTAGAPANHGFSDGHLNSYNECVTYTVAEAKNKLPELIRQAEAGTPVTITRRGIPVVEIVRKAEETHRKPVFGVLGRKKVVLDADWARPQEDIEAWLAGDV